MTAINRIEGIGAQMAAQLRAAGITQVASLLTQAATRRGRQNLAQATGINEKKILRWANMADLFRIKGVGEEYADLLEAAGVDTVPALARRNPLNLQRKMATVNNAKQLTRRVPTLEQVQSWVDQARTLPRMLHY